MGTEALALGLGLDEAMRIAETCEADVVVSAAEAAPPEAAGVLGLSHVRLSGGVAVVMANDPSGGLWNRAIGLGLTEPITDALIGEVVRLYRSAGAPMAKLQLAPALLPPDWDDICARHRLWADEPWLKLMRRLDQPIGPAGSDLRIDTLPDELEQSWGHTMLAGFGFPDDDHLRAMFVGRSPGLHRFAAWSGDDLVAGAGLLVLGDVASFTGAATLPGARGHGAQSVFTRLRLETARAAGCRWACIETAAPREGVANPSLHNTLRAGFVPLYERPNWVWRNDQ
ncbi:GNAT family N-acetyltransferase [Propionibacteriaceae bacterium G1746]|uniref:GNAT family N-acetyltransferase n=1 Tax=Aestuariimicrobium sp. G57 TaxID=3418485 RepID=UPI003C26452B